MKDTQWWAENWNDHDRMKAEIKAFIESNSCAPQTVIPQASIEDIKTIHALGGRRLFNSEVVELIRKPINLGRQMPYVGATGRRGRPARKTPYELGYERRRGLYQSLVRLPMGIRSNTGQHLVTLIQSLFSQARIGGVPARQEVRHVAQILTAMRIQPPDDSYLRKIRRRAINAG